MIFSDVDITKAIDSGDIGIDPFNKENLRAASYTLTLGTTLYSPQSVDFIDSRTDDHEYEEISLGEDGYLLEAGEFIISRTAEKITLSDKVAGFLATTGSRAQQGLDAILSSSFMEPGSDNHMACELHNVSKVPMRLFPGIRLVKAIFMPVQTPARSQGRGNDFFVRNSIE